MQQRYNVSDPIASGTYGTIHQCTVSQEYSEILEESGADPEAVQQMCAVKIQRHDPYFWDNFSFLREIDALMRTRSFPGTVDVLDCVLDTERECAFIVMDQYDGTLLQFVNQVPFEERMRHLPVVCAQLIITMAYLDRQGIAHRDIKPSNVLVQRAPTHGHAFGCHASACPDDCEDSCVGTNEEHRRYRDCMKLFAPLLSSSPLVAHYDKQHRIHQQQQQQQRKHPLQQMSTSLSPDIVLCDERGTPTAQTIRTGNDRWLSSTGYAYGCTREQEEDSEMLIDASELDEPAASAHNSVDRGFVQDEYYGEDSASETERSADCSETSSSEESSRHSDCTDDAYSDSEDCSGRDSHMRVDDNNVSSHRRRRRRRRHHSRDFEKEQAISVSLHASDGRPRSFPGISFMQQRSHLLHSSANCATADGETNTMLAGDLASLHRAPLVVICDFGLAKQLGPSRDTPCLVTLNFRPPEMFVDTSVSTNSSSSSLHRQQTTHQQPDQEDQCSPKRGRTNATCNQYRTNVDVWSLACVLLQYVTGSILFHGTNEYSVMKAMAEFVGGVPTAWKTIGWQPSTTQSTHAVRLESVMRRVSSAQFEGKPLFCDLLARMFHPSGTKRPSATQLLTHPFVAPYVARTTRFMCSVTRQRPTFCSGSVKSGRIRSRPLHETSRWAFQTSVDVSTELLDTRLGLQYTSRLTEKHRELMCDWLWEQNRTLRYNAGTALASIHNFDRFMSMAAKDTLRDLSQSDFVLIGIICFYLTIHYYEQYVVDLPTLIGACGYRYEARQVKRTIRNILIALHFQISTPSHWTLYCRHRSTMHMSHSMDTTVALLLYCLVRTVYFAASIPKAVLLMAVVERVRFNRLFEEQYPCVRLSPLQLRLERERAELRQRRCDLSAGLLSMKNSSSSTTSRTRRRNTTGVAAVEARTSLRATSDQNNVHRTTRGERTLSCEFTTSSIHRQQQQQEQQWQEQQEAYEPRRVVTRSRTRK